MSSSMTSITILLSQILLTSVFHPVAVSSKREHSATPPPLPVLPLPNYSQLKWQQRELIIFFHFGINTFTDREWGTGREDPNLFDPVGLDPAQWIRSVAQSGFSLAILTAKHHDGFCLWPSAYTEHSVASSRWRDGRGDVIRDFVNAARAGHVDAGLYLSPWDRHEPRYGEEREYNEFYLGQMQELLRGYRKVREIWFDGARGANAPNMSYYFSEWFSMAKQLQSSVNIFSDAGPDVRWVGNEDGFAGKTCWSTINRTSLSIGNSSIENYLNTGDPKGTDWIPPECDVSIRPNWFWHASERPKKLSTLLNIYYKSVGRNCVLLFNVPPNTTGLLSDSDTQRLFEFKSAIDAIFSLNLADNCSLLASSIRGGDGLSFGPDNVLDRDHLHTYWAPDGPPHCDHWIQIVKRDGWLRFNAVRIQEAIGLGQRIQRHEIYADGRRVAHGTTVGYKRLHRLKLGVIEARRIRIRIVKSKGLPLISSLGLYLDPYWNPKVKNVVVARYNQGLQRGPQISPTPLN